MLTVLPVVRGASRSLGCQGQQRRSLGNAVLALYSIGCNRGTCLRRPHKEVTIAVDPFDMRFPLFRGLSWAFPQYTYWNWETWLLDHCMARNCRYSHLVRVQANAEGAHARHYPTRMPCEIQHTETLPESGRTRQQTELR